jgi:uncharacterized protein with HEPN domain
VIDPKSGRFRASTPSDTDAASEKFDLIPEILANLADLAADALTIVGRGRENFLEPGNRLDRHAADAIVIKVQELAVRLPQTFRDQHPAVPWTAIRGTRNLIGHDYHSIDYELVWTVLERGLPELVANLGL